MWASSSHPSSLLTHPPNWSLGPFPRTDSPWAGCKAPTAGTGQPVGPVGLHSSLEALRGAGGVRMCSRPLRRSFWLGQSMPLEQDGILGQGSSRKRRECPQLAQLRGPQERRAGARNLTTEPWYKQDFCWKHEGAGPEAHRNSGWEVQEPGAFRAGCPISPWPSPGPGLLTLDPSGNLCPRPPPTPEALWCHWLPAHLLPECLPPAGHPALLTPQSSHRTPAREGSLYPFAGKKTKARS